MATEKRLIDAEQAKRATYEEVFWTESEQAAVRHFLAKLPTVDAVSRGVLDQVRWERDIAMEQLADYGLSLGERADVVKVVRCKYCKHMERTPDSLRWCNVWNGINGSGDEGFCNYGERKDNA